MGFFINYYALKIETDRKYKYLHSKIPEIYQIVPVLDVGSRDDQLLFLSRLLAVVGVPEEPDHGLERERVTDMWTTFLVSLE